MPRPVRPLVAKSHNGLYLDLGISAWTGAESAGSMVLSFTARLELPRREDWIFRNEAARILFLGHGETP